MYRSISFYNVIFSAITLLLQLRFTGTRQALRRTLLTARSMQLSRSHCEK